MDLIQGLAIAATDRWSGKLDGVAVDAESKRITHLIVKRGFLFAKRYYVAIDNVARCDHEGIYLNISMSEAFSPSDSEEIIQHGISVSLDSKSCVETLGGPSLRLKGVRVDSKTSGVTHLILHERGEDDLVISVDHLMDMSSSGLSLDIREGEAANFPLYRQDNEIEADVWKALYESEEISDVDLKWVTINVMDGIVTIRGNMRDPSGVTEAEVVTALVPGVAAVVNHITSDWDIELKIAQVIANTAPRLSNDLSIHAQLGVVSLYGHVSSEKEKDDVLRAIPSVRGVRSVQDSLEVRATVAVAVSEKDQSESVGGESIEPESREQDDEAEGAIS
jgi:osmotically-inducible protein OsmY